MNWYHIPAMDITRGTMLGFALWADDPFTAKDAAQALLGTGYNVGEPLHVPELSA
jgi:hypothetical protein